MIGPAEPPSEAQPLRSPLLGEFWGGLAAMLVALPSAIAFGVTILSPLGAAYAALGALAGILGASALGVVAPAFGGTPRLISAPCAPAAAVLAAAATELLARGHSPQQSLLLLSLIGLVCGGLQVAFGKLGLGRLIKYMPYPVVSGYLSGVGLIIIVSQVPRLLGAGTSQSFWTSLESPSSWQWQAIAVGMATIAVMLLAPRATKKVPAAIVGLGAGVLAYFVLGIFDRSLLEPGNGLVIGRLAGLGDGVAKETLGRWSALPGLAFSDVVEVMVPAATLAVLLSIDTLKTCVVLDALTRSRHDSNKELIGQGLGNIASAAIGGVAGSGTMGATIVNISSGARTRASSLIEGALAVCAYLVLGALIAWVPIAALAGILIVIGVRMFDVSSLNLLRSRSTMLDFAVIVVVVAVAETVSLIAASTVGIGLAMLLFIREQTGGSVVRRKTYGNQMFSKRMRLPGEMAVLEERGARTAIFELQGSLFFGTAEQLYGAVASEISRRSYVILDMRRVQSVDVTAAHVLEQLEDALSEHRGMLIFSALPRSVPSGQDMKEYFDAVGLVKSQHQTRTFRELDEALEWVEARILEDARVERALEQPLELREMDVFGRRKEETLAALEACMEQRSFRAGERIFSKGDDGGELFLVRRGAVRILLPLSGDEEHHLATFGRGDFFGEISFIDGERRSANAVALSDTDLFVLPRERFDALAGQHHRLALNLFEGLAHTLAMRLRYTNAELRLLEEN